MLKNLAKMTQDSLRLNHIKPLEIKHGFTAVQTAEGQGAKSTAYKNKLSKNQVTTHPFFPCCQHNEHAYIRMLSCQRRLLKAPKSTTTGPQVPSMAEPQALIYPTHSTTPKRFCPSNRLVETTRLPPKPNERLRSCAFCKAKRSF
jgi:hypothetical protein